MPEELWSELTPSLEHLRVFGCTAYAHVPKELRQKLDPKGKEFLFMGYCEDSKGYKLIDPETKKITIADSELNQLKKTDDDADSETTSEYSECSEDMRNIEEVIRSKPVEASTLRSPLDRINQSTWKIM